MASFNRITIVGYLGRDPELRYTPNGTPVCDFSVATSERRRGRDGNEGEETTTWFRVTFWGRQAEFCSQYFTKGKPVYIEGRLSQREWTDRDGNKRYSLEVHGSEINFIGNRGDEAPGARGARAGQSPSGGGRSYDEPRRDEGPLPDGPISDEDIPF
jgi:single-strand DNA-binding protein